MHADYYLNTLYPLQDKILTILTSVENRFYLTGGTALSRAYLHHRYSDDLDFFVNYDETYKEQVERIHNTIKESGLSVERASMHDSFSRWFIHEKECSLKIDFVNDIGYRVGHVNKTSVFVRTDTMRNILSNKLTALGRLEAKDVVDIIYIARNLSYNWKDIFNEAEQKDLWVNPVDTAALLEQFPVEKIDTIAWAVNKPDKPVIEKWLKTILSDILKGDDNTLFKK